MSAIRYELGSDQILTLTIDMPGQSANTMNAAFRDALSETAAKVKDDLDNIRGIIIASAKKTFFAGGDLKELHKVTRKDARTFEDMVNGLKSHMRFLETTGKPVVAAINGSALGGGLEIALACHYRVAINDDSIQLGLPEVTLGLLPGGGGTQRLPRMIGLEAAFPFLMEGKKVNPKAALKAGIINELADSADDMITKARAFIEANPKCQQPWDQKGFRFPGGAPHHPAMAQKLAIAPAMLKQKTKGCYPAPERILSAAVEGAQVDFDNGSLIETRYFAELVIGQVAKNMTGTFWFQLNAIKAGGSRPEGVEKETFRKVGVLGAGMMGAGIAYSTATRGIDVVLKDVSVENAEKGKSYSENLLAKKVSRGRMTEEQKADILSRIKATDSSDDLEGCDLVIEAVFEDSGLKAKVTQEAEPKLVANGIFASNTSTIPITQLAGASANAENFIGLHFFSPVDKMQLVEIIVGEKTSDETLARSFDYVQQIGKIPVVVNDSRGFFTSRVFGTFVNEGICMLGEGIHPASIENAGVLAGMPVGPLAISDEVSMTLMQHIRDQSRKDTEAAGGTWNPHPAEAVIDAMVNEHGRKGKAAGAGFYEYPANGKKHLWPELETLFVNAEKARTVKLQELKDRILFIQAIETVRCLEEGVLRTVEDANIGSIFGIGYAPWTGGAIQFINQYGVRAFTERASALAETYGERFAPPKLLQEKAETNTPFA
ncbi:3-hydroxyacyl-CoA dehydrogenase/enoyl-CoA hydratase/3-hydroxybutyryl-CoA epimerase [Marinobacter sp. 3-2]|jgi:3-hydroxyacyl-CoA dehydrogenase / enoyl-CoA hydratase / 3-hydroxybutyryl-CoA epimerase|uniref:3-hydroxyacyl-CoA dehydrogenase NAD-binding domain-containing protein n=1 Tax=Marinobacter sp. 3-2 TaxID=2485141 RepID=UPI000D359C55|nr:3-hydroxyacyl-CoA dehydrogenase NAD-binding domain-containing protein [Marinobacter sp. 3-2]ROQ39212.1 3-hydroxyacyl-CoA dehydrogenase/enoyl-CoA hydratase/3-hydroxybutyryl-CoA epimerase [Marinobacter sp. 3-2]